ncbi:MAG TPA: hypothetical protein VMV86_01295, partial [Methanosarcinales archaeon]|nr:hypothetical protein [Methanosarcinales archaeon]
SVGPAMQSIKKNFQQTNNVISMTNKQFQKASPLIKNVNTGIGKQATRSARLAERVRRLTLGFRGFRMEMLSVMFFGMAIQRFFTGLIQPALQLTGVFDIFTAALQLLFLPVALMVLDWAILFLDWVSNLPEGTKKLIGIIALLGIAFGTFLFLVGTIALGIGGLLMVFGGIISPIIAFVGLIFSAALALFNFLPGIGKVALAVLAFVGLAPMVRGMTDTVQEQGGIWNSLKGAVGGFFSYIGGLLSLVVGLLDSLWERMIDSAPVMTFLENLGLTADQIEMLKDPLDTVKTLFVSVFQKVKNLLAPILGDIGNFVATTIEQLKTDFKKFFTDIKLPDSVKDTFDNFMKLLGGENGKGGLIQVIQELATTLSEILNSALFDVLNTLASVAAEIFKIVGPIMDILEAAGLKRTATGALAGLTKGPIGAGIGGAAGFSADLSSGSGILGKITDMVTYLSIIAVNSGKPAPVSVELYSRATTEDLYQSSVRASGGE